MVTLRIDPQNARGANVSQVFDDVQFIPLETTKESLFGSITDLKIAKNKFILFDYDTRSVLIFSKDGKFKGKIDASKVPKDETDKTKTEFFGYQIVEENQDTVIALYSNKYFFFFDLNGKQIKKVSQKDYSLNNDYKLADKETAIRNYFVDIRGRDTASYELGLIRKNKDSVGYFPYSNKRYQTDQFLGSSRLYDYGVKNELFFLSVYNFNIYKVTPAKVSLAYRILFPANNSLPKDFMENPAYVNKRIEYFQKNPKIFYAIYNTYLIGNNLYMGFRKLGSPTETKTALIYNTKTAELTSLQDLTPDSLSSFLPVTDAGAFYDFTNNGFNLYKDGYLYTSYSSLAMFTFKEQMGNKNDKFSPLMQEYFKTQSRRSNPVIIQLKPKKQ